MGRVSQMMSEIEQKPEVSERVTKLKDELLSASPNVDTQRLQFLLDVYEHGEGQPAVILRARLFEKICAEKSIFIDDNPIVGNLTGYKYGGYPLPELGCRWMKKIDRFRLPLGEALVTKEDQIWIDKAVEAWKGRNLFNRTQETIYQSDGTAISQWQKTGLATEIVPGGFMGTGPDYAKVLERGLTGIITEIEETRAALDIGHFESLKKWHFHNAAHICLNTAITLAERYAALAQEMSLREKDPSRKQELERIAETCAWVPANPARSFYEALQCVWFLQLMVWIEAPIIGNGAPLRFTQYLWPFYQKDKVEGKITDEEVIELIQLYYLRVQSLTHVLPPFGVKYSSSRVAMNLTIGGLTPDGNDATNHLDYLVLEAKRRLQIPEPLIVLLYHDRLTPEFLLKCIDLIRTGVGQPAFLSADRATQRNLYHHGQEGITLEEARNNAIVACVQNTIPGYSYGHWEGHCNTAKFLELALNDGLDPLTGMRIGLQTGKVESFQSYGQLYEAVVKQLQYFVPLLRQASRIAWSLQQEFPVPFGSALVNDCIQRGMDQVDGGGRYGLGSGYSFIGVIDLANSLAAINKLVFQEKKLTLKQLTEVLAADFEGYGEIHRMCMDAPKYGNDNEGVDMIAANIYKLCGEVHQRFPDHLGRPIKPEAFSVTVHAGLGEFTGALPSGRKARVALTDASVSAQPGTDRSGPTALVNSAARVIDTVAFGCNHFNMKFHPSALADMEGARKLLALIKTYMDYGGYHLQFNCVSSDVLRDAQLHPEEYRDLVVRVAGFSAYFVTLDKVVQDEIITRTEFRFA